MSEERKEGLTEEELEREIGEVLPDREQVSVIKQPWEPGGGDSRSRSSRLRLSRTY